MTSEADVQRAIIDALVWDGWLIIRVNQGGRHEDETGRYVRFAFWQVLSMNQQDSGISDVIAMKGIEWYTKSDKYLKDVTLLAVECKAPGKKKNLQAVLDEDLGEDGILFQKLSERDKGQAIFLFAIRDHGGIAVVADCLEDVESYLDRVKVE